MKLEQAIQELDKISKTLDNPNTSLDESIELFQKGVELATVCKQLLESGKGKIVAIKREYDKLVEVDIQDELQGQ